MVRPDLRTATTLSRKLLDYARDYVRVLEILDMIDRSIDEPVDQEELSHDQKKERAISESR
jgi:hypothetical protein